MSAPKVISNIFSRMHLRHEVRGRDSRAWWRTELRNPSWGAALSFAQLAPTCLPSRLGP